MSTWRILARSLYAIGGSGTMAQFGDGGSAAEGAALYSMRQMGLVETNGVRGPACVYTLTPLGRDWCEGRVQEYRGHLPCERELARRALRRGDKINATPTKRLRFVATWLAALPRPGEVRLCPSPVARAHQMVAGDQSALGRHPSEEMEHV